MSERDNGVVPQAVVLTEDTRVGDESGAGLMRNRCAFTSRDQGADWPEAFTYAVVMGWDSDDPDDDDPHGAMREQAAKWGWDADLVEFLRQTHRRFTQLADRAPVDGAGTTPADHTTTALRAELSPVAAAALHAHVCGTEWDEWNNPCAWASEDTEPSLQPYPVCCDVDLTGVADAVVGALLSHLPAPAGSPTPAGARTPAALAELAHRLEGEANHLIDSEGNLVGYFVGADQWRTFRAALTRTAREEPTDG